MMPSRRSSVVLMPCPRPRPSRKAPAQSRPGNVCSAAVRLNTTKRRCPGLRQSTSARRAWVTPASSAPAPVSWGSIRASSRCSEPTWAWPRASEWPGHDPGHAYRGCDNQNGYWSWPGDRNRTARTGPACFLKKKKKFPPSMGRAVTGSAARRRPTHPAGGNRERFHPCSIMGAPARSSRSGTPAMAKHVPVTDR